MSSLIVKYTTHESNTQSSYAFYFFAYYAPSLPSSLIDGSLYFHLGITVEKKKKDKPFEPNMSNQNSSSFEQITDQQHHHPTTKTTTTTTPTTIISSLLSSPFVKWMPRWNKLCDLASTDPNIFPSLWANFYSRSHQTSTTYPSFLTTSTKFWPNYTHSQFAYKD